MFDFRSARKLLKTLWPFHFQMHDFKRSEVINIPEADEHSAMVRILSFLGKITNETQAKVLRAGDETAHVLRIYFRAS